MYPRELGILPGILAPPVILTCTVLPRCYALLAVTPPPPIFGRNYCIGLFYLHYTPPPSRAARAGLPYYSSARVRVLQV